MSIFPLVIVLFLCVDGIACVSDGKQRPKEKLLLILLDGVRWDYIKKGMKGFGEINKLGVQAEYLIPVFPSMSFPNYYSLATGLYAENHGMVMNYMRDARRNQTFMMLTHPNSLQSFWWEEAEPIWITAAKEGLRTRLYLWPGGDVRIHNTTANISIGYSMQQDLKTFHQHVDDALQKLKDDNADLVQIYCEYADYVGHENGPGSKKLKDAMVNIDSEIQTLIEVMRKLDLTNKVNVIIVSDHGMTPTDGEHVEYVSLADYVNTTFIQHILGQGAIVSVFPNQGFTERVFHDLSKAKAFEVWKKNDIPEKYHIKNNNRTAPILVLAKPGYFITPIEKNKVQIPDVERFVIKKGYHGYDVEEVKDMRGIFFAFGPGFESNIKVPAIHNVDVYNIMMHLLDLQPNPNNGSWKSVFGMIKGENEKNGASNLWYEGISSVLSFIGCIYMYSLIVLVHSQWI